MSVKVVSQVTKQFKTKDITKLDPLHGTHLVAERGRRSDAATSDKDKQICLSTLPRIGFDAEVCSYLAFHS